MTNADKFKNLFGIYATELWSMPEKDFLKWLNSEAVNSSKIPNNSDTINRQAAIDALELKKDKNAKGDIGGFYNKIIQNDIDTLMQLPSAQPYTEAEIQKIQELEQAELEKAFELGKAEANKWIPCSERLPEPKGAYSGKVYHKSYMNSSKNLDKYADREVTDEPFCVDMRLRGSDVNHWCIPIIVIWMYDYDLCRK